MERAFGRKKCADLQRRSRDPIVARFIPADDRHGNHRLQRPYFAPHTRTCLARANNVRVAEANAPHIETVQTALRTAEKEAVLPYTSMQAFPSEIQAEDITTTLPAVLPLATNWPRPSLHYATILRAPSKMTKFWPTWDKSAVLPAYAVKFAIPKRPPKDGHVNKLLRKLLHHNLPYRQRRPVQNRLRLLKIPLYLPTCRTKRNRSRAACRTGRPDGENRYSRAARFPNLDCAD